MKKFRFITIAVLLLGILPACDRANSDLLLSEEELLPEVTETSYAIGQVYFESNDYIESSPAVASRCDLLDAQGNLIGTDYTLTNNFTPDLVEIWVEAPGDIALFWYTDLPDLGEMYIMTTIDGEAYIAYADALTFDIDEEVSTHLSGTFSSEFYAKISPTEEIAIGVLSGNFHLPWEEGNCEC